MNYNELISDLKTKSDNIKTGGLKDIATFKHDWLSCINESNNDYKLLLITPMSRKQNSREQTYAFYDLIGYLFQRNVNTNGEICSITERDTAWQNLETLVWRFIAAINEDKTNYCIMTDVETIRDNLNLGVDDLIFIKFKFNLRVLYCE